MPESSFNIYSMNLTYKEEVKGINLHHKTVSEMENYYAVILGGSVFRLTEKEYQRIHEYLKDSCGHACINDKRITGFSTPSEKGQVIP
jgi:hypothetical protein